MNIYTSYFGNIKRIKKEINNPYFCTIARYYAKFREYIDEAIYEFMPSKELLSLYKNRLIDEEEYVKSFNESLFYKLYKIEASGGISKFFESINEENIFLLCYENKNDFCHRHLVSKMLNGRYNLNIKEY